MDEYENYWRIRAQSKKKNRKHLSDMLTLLIHARSASGRNNVTNVALFRRRLKTLFVSPIFS